MKMWVTLVETMNKNSKNPHFFKSKENKWPKLSRSTFFRTLEISLMFAAIQRPFV